MATSKTQSQKRPATPGQSTSSSSLPLIIGIVVGVIALAGLAAVILANQGGTGEETVGQVAPVTVDGGSLPLYDSSVQPDPGVGMEAAGLSGQSFDGSPVSLTPGNGSPQMLVFLAHWCPHCQVEVPVLTEWINTGGAPDDLEIAAVSTAVSADRENYPPSEWLEREGWPKPVLVDSENGDAQNAYGLTSFPYFVLIDEEGRVQARVSGEVDAATLDALVDQTLYS